MDSARSHQNSPHVHRQSFIRSFSKSQVASFVATIADYGVLFGLTELCGVWYVIATAAGALSGAVTNFYMNRHWSFRAAHVALGPQAKRYAVTSAVSLVLNTGGVYLVTEFLHVHYSISVVTVSLLVGFLFNYPMQRHWVFR